MSQYRQWLHYREIDQLLRSQLAVSEHELEQLQAQVEILGKQNFPIENPIFQALLTPQPATPQQDKWHTREDSARDDKPSWIAGKQPEAAIEDIEDIVIEDVEEEATISPALLAWSRLPNFDTVMVEEQEANGLPQVPESSLPRSIEPLLPADMSAFIDAYYPTNPQMKIPWWLHNIDPYEQRTEENDASEPQSDSDDYLIQRWFERWGKPSMKKKRSQEDQPYEPGH